MTLYVDPIEALWVSVTAATLVLTLYALFEARRGLRLAKSDTTTSRAARETVAAGNLRREFLRTVVQALLLSIALPGLFVDRPIALSPPLVALVLVPVVLFISTMFDARDRGRLAEILVDLVRVERDALALESSVQENIALTKHAAAKSEEAIDIGNHSREALMRLTEIVGGKEDRDPGP